MTLSVEMKERLKNNLIFHDDPDAVGAITILVKHEASQESAEELVHALEQLLKEL